MYKRVQLILLTAPCAARLCLNKPDKISLSSGFKTFVLHILIEARSDACMKEDNVIKGVNLF